MAVMCELSILRSRVRRALVLAAPLACLPAARAQETVQAVPGCSVYITEPLIRGAYVEATVAAPGALPWQCGAADVQVSRVTFAEPCTWLGSDTASVSRVGPCGGAGAVLGTTPTAREHPAYGLQRRSSYAVDDASCTTALVEGGTSLDEVVSARVHPGGHVFSKGLHCRREQPGFIFIRNACPGAVALTFEVASDVDRGAECRITRTPGAGFLHGARFIIICVACVAGPCLCGMLVLLACLCCRKPKQEVAYKMQPDKYHSLELSLGTSGAIPAVRQPSPTSQPDSPDLGTSSSVHAPWRPGASGLLSVQVASGGPEGRAGPHRATWHTTLPAAAPPSD